MASASLAPSCSDYQPTTASPSPFRCALSTASLLLSATRPLTSSSRSTSWSTLATASPSSPSRRALMA